MQIMKGWFYKVVYTVYGERGWSYCYSEDKHTISAICKAFFMELGIPECDIIGCSRICKVPVSENDLYIL